MATEEAITITRSFKFRLLPSRKQHQALARILEEQRILYNAALEERIDFYRKRGKGRSFIDQCIALTELRRDPEYANTPLKLQRWTLNRLDSAYKGFYARAQKGGGGGPRFRKAGRWSSFGFVEFRGITLDRGTNRLRFKGMPNGLRVHMHRELPNNGKILGCNFKRDAKGWSVAFQVRLRVAIEKSSGGEIGVDVGIINFCALSNGDMIPNPRCAQKSEREIRRKQRAFSRCKAGSNRRKKVKRLLARAYQKTANGRLTYLHQVSAMLVRKYSLVAIEKLNIKWMVRGNFGKGIHDVAWGVFFNFLHYKGERTGTQIVSVDPKNTSQACSGCGVIVEKKISKRWHTCPDCELSLDRDVNAARNILHRAVLRPGFAKQPCVAA